VTTILNLIGEAGRWLATALTGLFCKKQGAEVSKNLVVKTLSDGESWTCPAGVTSVQVSGLLNVENVDSFAGKAFDKDLVFYRWGWNALGQLGDGSTTNRSVPTPIPFKFKKVFTPPRFPSMFALNLNDELVAWGQNYQGMLGVGNVANQTAPQPVLGGLGPIKKVQCSSHSAGILLENGDLYMMGVNSSGTLGDGTTVAKSSPVLVVGGLKWKEFFTDGASTYAIRDNDDLYAWGNNGSGQLGDNSITNRASPVQVVGGLKWKSLGGYSTSAFEGLAGPVNQGGFILSPNLYPTMHAINSNDDMYGWGYNIDGQIGDNTRISRSSPVLVVGGLKWKEASVSAGITTGDNLYLWGLAESTNPLGDGTLAKRSSPVLILSNAKKFKKHYSGGYYAITNANDLYAWGGNANGQLGDGTTTVKTTPVNISSGTKFIDVFLGSHYISPNYFIYAHALTESRKLMGTGSNNSNALGDGSATNRTTFTPVYGDYNWIANSFVTTAPVYVPVTPGTTYSVAKRGSAVKFADFTLAQAEQVIISYLA
jgi:alpha-tubulin suppressor-like RCC1 family protein